MPGAEGVFFRTEKNTNITRTTQAWNYKQALKKQ